HREDCRIGWREVGKTCPARLRRSRGIALPEGTMVTINEPRQKDVDAIRVDGSTAPCRIRAPLDGALLDFEMTCVGDRLGDVEQKVVVPEDIDEGCQGGRRPIDLSIFLVPGLESFGQSLLEERPQALAWRERGLLIPQIADVDFAVGADQKDVGMFRPADPVETRNHRRSGARLLIRIPDTRFSNDAEQRSVRWPQDLLRI